MVFCYIVEAWIVSLKKKSFAWKEGVTAQSHNLDIQSFSNFAYPTSILSALSSELRVFLCFLDLKTHVSATCKTLLPIVAPMPPIKISLSSSEFRHVTSDMNYINALLTPCHFLRFRPSLASRCTNVQLLTTKSLK